MGIPGYMAPEQFQGNEVDYATDIYSLGATLYKALTGQLPYEGTRYFQILTELLKILNDADNTLQGLNKFAPKLVKKQILTKKELKQIWIILDHFNNKLKIVKNECKIFLPLLSDF